MQKQVEDKLVEEVLSARSAAIANAHLLEAEDSFAAVAPVINQFNKKL